MTTTFLRVGQDLDWGQNINGWFGQKVTSGKFAFGGAIHVDREKTIPVAVIGLFVGVSALLVAAAALAIIFACPVVAPFLVSAVGVIAMPVLIGIAAGAGTLGIIGTIFGGAAANSWRVGQPFGAEGAAASRLIGGKNLFPTDD